MPRRVLVGAIPERLMHYRRRPCPAIRRWDDLGDEAEHKLEVEPTFVVDAASDKAKKTALEWANTREWPASGNGGHKAVDHPPHRIFETGNVPIPWVRIVTLEHRAEGGRAYKVLAPVVAGSATVTTGIDDGVPPGYVDLREDVLLDCLLHGGCGKDGVLKGPFIWARVGSQMKLVRVGSDLHKALREADVRGKTPTLAAGALVPGTVYVNRKCEPAVYLGQADTDVLTFKNEGGWYAGGIHRGAPECSWAYRRNMQMWVVFPTWRAGSTDEEMVAAAGKAMQQVENYCPVDATKMWVHVDFIKARAAARAIGTIKLPDDIHATVRGHASREWRAYLDRRDGVDKSHNARIGVLAHLSASWHARAVGGEQPRVDVYNNIVPEKPKGN